MHTADKFPILNTFIQAIRTVGLTEDDLFRMASEMDSENYTKENFNNSLTSGTAISLAKLLCLDFSMLQYGYVEKFHQRCIGREVYEKTYRLPMTKEVTEFGQEYEVNLKSYSGISF